MFNLHIFLFFFFFLSPPLVHRWVRSQSGALRSQDTAESRADLGRAPSRQHHLQLPQWKGSAGLGHCGDVITPRGPSRWDTLSDIKENLHYKINNVAQNWLNTKLWHSEASTIFSLLLFIFIASHALYFCIPLFLCLIIHLTMFSPSSKDSSCLFRLTLCDSSPQWPSVVSQMMYCRCPSPWWYKCPPHCLARVRPHFLSSLSVSRQSTKVSIVHCVDGKKQQHCLLPCCSTYLLSPTWSVYRKIFFNMLDKFIPTAGQLFIYKLSKSS